MSTFQAIILGIVQGLSEFLPISSSGHLILIPELLHWNVQDRAFDVMVHMGTLLAVIIYFRKKMYDMVRSLFVKKDLSGNRRLFFLLCVSVFPAAIIGFFFGDTLSTWDRSAPIVATNLIFWGIILFIADWYSKTRSAAHQDLSRVTISNSFLIGLAQALALIPGTSRSGITMTAGLFQKFSKTAAAEFSFLMSIPVTALAGASTLRELLIQGTHGVSVSAMVYGGVASFISGIVAIWLLFAVIKKISFTPFVLYRIAIGIIIFVLIV